MVSAGRDSVTHPGMLEQLWKNAGHSQKVFDFSTRRNESTQPCCFLCWEHRWGLGCSGCELGEKTWELLWKLCSDPKSLRGTAKSHLLFQAGITAIESGIMEYPELEGTYKVHGFQLLIPVLSRWCTVPISNAIQVVYTPHSWFQCCPGGVQSLIAFPVLSRRCTVPIPNAVLVMYSVLTH